MKLFLGVLLLTFTLFATEIYDPETNNSKYRLLINTFSEKHSEALLVINKYDFSHDETKDTKISLVLIEGVWYLEVVGIMSIPQAKKIISIHHYKVYVLIKT